MRHTVLPSAILLAGLVAACTSAPCPAAGPTAARLQNRLTALQQQQALDHDLLFKLRRHILLTPAQQTSYTESAWSDGK